MDYLLLSIMFLSLSGSGVSRWCQVPQEAGMWSPSGTHGDQEREGQEIGCKIKYWCDSSIWMSKDKV